MYDVIIIGGGAAGMTASIYTSRKKLKTAIITVDTGGQTNLTNNIENYPGILKSTGWQLMKEFKKQTNKYGVKLIYGKVNKLVTGKTFEITTVNKEKYTSKTVILAFGKIPNTLGIKGEEKFLGKGVHVCGVHETPKYSKKTTIVIGGGNSAFQTAIALSKVAKKVYLVHRQNKFRADQILVEKLKNKKNVEFILNSEIKEIKGKNHVESVIIDKEIKADGVFIEIGQKLDTQFLEGVSKLQNGEIMIDARCNTNIKGLFACGDVTTVPFKQTIISAGEGAKAGLEAYRYLTGGKMAVSIDWNH